MNSAIERERRSRMNFHVPVTEHPELKDWDQEIVNRALQRDLGSGVNMSGS
jgi:hypothetical protein